VVNNPDVMVYSVPGLLAPVPNSLWGGEGPKHVSKLRLQETI